MRTRAGCRSIVRGFGPPPGWIALVAGLCVAMSLILPPAVPAATFVVKNFEALVAEAEQIVVGTATGATAQKLGGGTIVTDVTLVTSHVLKGPAAAVVILRVVGGTVGDETMEVAGVPQLQPGRRYIVFVKGNGRAMFPVVGGSHGLFRVVRDPALDTDVVLNAHGMPLGEAPVTLGDFVAATLSELGLR